MRCSSSDSQTTPATLSLNDLPGPLDIAFVRGDQVNRKFLLSGICYTAERPLDLDGLPMYSVDEEAPDGEVSPTALVAPWEERFFHAEIRNGYTSTMRYFNGWVPWYGSAPRNWTWWLQSSLKGIFACESEYSEEFSGTVIDIELPSFDSAKILPAHTYSWDLESAHPIAKDEVGNPTYYDGLKTWLGGNVTVKGDWTLNTPIGVP